MTPILLTEIISALIATSAIAVLFAQALRSRRASRNSRARLIRHRFAGCLLVGAGAVHGVAATVYSSGAHEATYVLGWLSLVLFSASGVSMLSTVRNHLPQAMRVHVICFALGMLCLAGHAIAGRF